MKPLIILILSTLTATSAPLTVIMTVKHLGQGQVNITSRTREPIDGSIQLVLLSSPDPGAHTWTPVITNTYSGITITNTVKTGAVATFYKVRGL